MNTLRLLTALFKHSTDDDRRPPAAATNSAAPMDPAESRGFASDAESWTGIVAPVPNGATYKELRVAVPSRHDLVVSTPNLTSYADGTIRARDASNRRHCDLVRGRRRRTPTVHTAGGELEDAAPRPRLAADRHASRNRRAR